MLVIVFDGTSQEISEVFEETCIFNFVVYYRLSLFYMFGKKKNKFGD